MASWKMDIPVLESMLCCNFHCKDYNTLEAYTLDVNFGRELRRCTEGVAVLQPLYSATASDALGQADLDDYSSILQVE